MKHAIYPGSFDPITLGHIDIVKRVRPLFDSLTIVVSQSQDKKYLFSFSERVQLIQTSLKEFDVQVQVNRGLTALFAEKIGAQVIVRGLRNSVDFEYEMAMADINKKLVPHLETLFISASTEQKTTSSRLVKEIYAYGGKVSGFVNREVEEHLKLKFRKNE